MAVATSGSNLHRSASEAANSLSRGACVVIFKAGNDSVRLAQLAGSLIQSRGGAQDFDSATLKAPTVALPRGSLVTAQ